MKTYMILYNVVEMLLFVGASLFVTNQYLKDSSPLSMAFGLFLLLIFMNQVARPFRNTEQYVKGDGDEK